MVAEMKFNNGYLVAIDTDTNIIIECPNCHMELYTTNFNQADLANSVRHADDFEPIGKQPKAIDGQQAPDCHKCDTPWVTIEGPDVVINTTQGILRYGD